SLLAEKGLIGIVRKENGRSTSGRPIFGGWGGKNRYDLTGCAVADVAKTCAAVKTSDLDRDARRDRSVDQPKSIRSSRPNPLSLTHPNRNPSYLSFDSETSPTNEVWRAHLLALIGADKMYACFRELRISYIRDGICYLSIKSPTARMIIRSEYEDYLLKALQ